MNKTQNIVFKKALVMFMAVIMVFTYMPSMAWAESMENNLADEVLSQTPAPQAAEGAVTIRTGDAEGLTEFALSVEPINRDAAPVTSNFQIKNGRSVPVLREYTYTVPAGTEEVTIFFTTSDSENGFFVEAENGTVTMNDFLQLKSKPEEAIKSTTVRLKNGKGSTKCILPYLPSGVSGQWWLNKSKIYQFHFETAPEPIKIKTPDAEGLTQFTLSTEPLNKTTAPITSKFQFKGGPSKDWLYESTYTVPAGTKEVTISFTSSDPKYGFFMEVENGTVSPNDFMQFAANKKPENPMTETTVTLTDGKGSTKCILAYLPSGYSGPKENPTTIYKYSANGHIYQFHFVEASDEVQIKTDLPERVEYNQNAAAEPLKLEVEAPEGSGIQYTWYQGETPETVTTVIDGENTDTYTPATDTVGVTYYRVEATVTETGGSPVTFTLKSATTKVVVKAPNVTFSLGSWKMPAPYKLQKYENSDQIYTVKIPVDNYNATTDLSARLAIYTFRGQLSGTIPDGVTIEKAWSGSPADDFDLTKEGALTVDYDTNTFVLDLTKAASPEAAYITEENSSQYWHLLGRCLYLQTKDEDNNTKLYTIAADSERLSVDYRPYLPSSVSLLTEEGTALPEFQVEFPSEGEIATSVFAKTLSSETPVVLHAQVCSRDEGVEGFKLNALLPYAAWKESQLSWVVVNGQKIGGSFHGKTEAADGISSAFTLKPGLNVVEVYTNMKPYYFSNKATSTSVGGIHENTTETIPYEGSYRYKPVGTSCVVYLIDYQGEAAETVPQDNLTDTSLQEVQALRFGPSNSIVTACQMEQSEEGYTLMVPESFNTDAPEDTLHNEYTHAVLLAAKPKVPGATVSFSGVDGLVVGESVADSAFLNMEALYGETNKSFTMSVTAADGETKKDYPVKVIFASDVTRPVIRFTNNQSAGKKVFDENTYVYYFDYFNQKDPSTILNITLPTGMTAVMSGGIYGDGKSFISGKQIELSPWFDFYKLTLTDANQTARNYYFITRRTGGAEISDLSAFATGVKAMPEPDALTSENLSRLECLIAQYEALDEESKALLENVPEEMPELTGVLEKYQALVAAGLKLKGSKNAANLYEKISALPKASEVTEANAAQVKADVAAIRKAMTEEDKALLDWAGSSVLAKLEAVEKAAGGGTSGGNTGGGGGGGAIGPIPSSVDVITVKETTSGEVTTVTKTTIDGGKAQPAKNEQGEAVSKILANVSKEIAKELAKQAESNKSDLVTITVKSGDASWTEIAIPKDSLTSIAKDSKADLLLKTNRTQVRFAHDALTALTTGQTGDTITISINEKAALTDAQKSAEPVIGKTGKLFTVSAKAGDKFLTDLGGAKAGVSLPLSDALKGKDILLVSIDENGICTVLPHSVETVNNESYLTFETDRLGTFAAVEKADAEKEISAQKQARAKALLQDVKLQVKTTKTSKKSVKAQVSVKNNKTAIKELKAMGYTVKYRFYRSTKKASGYRDLKTKSVSTFTNTKGVKGTRYYYKARVFVYDGKTLVAKSTLKQCSYGTRIWKK